MLPQRKHNPRSMRRWRSMGVNLPSRPRMEAAGGWIDLLEGENV